MTVEQRILSDITVHMKYAKYLPKEQRRETWEEIVKRNMKMHIAKYPMLAPEIIDVYNDYVLPKKVMPSMRSLQFAGKPVEINNTRLFNCSFLHMNDWVAFSEVMFLLLGGSGVGYSVQKHHVEELPEIRIPTKKRRYLIGDSIEGWADAVKILTKAYFFGSSLPIFDFRDIRPKGAQLITSGGKAPGPEPLKECLFKIQQIFERKKNGEKLTTVEVHDINCFIADAVLSGGIRRAALIALFSFNDEEMLTCKFGNWWELNPQRGRANNSVVIIRKKIKKPQFLSLWEKVQASGSGEPGFMFSDNAEWGANPCVEISLKNCQFCNLTTINASTVINQEDLNGRSRAAAFLGTLQAGYTDFHYLRDKWKRTTEKDALLGVSMTGIASGSVLSLNIEEAAEEAVKENKRVAYLIEINPAARVTAIKPEGTSSLVLGSSSGVHAWHWDYYLRRLRVGKNESIYTHLAIYHPELLEDDFFKPNIQAIITVPQKAPKGAITRNETALDLLERVKRLHTEWIKPGHISGDNNNNVSATISIKDDEWEEVGEWLWKNKDSYTGLSFLPQDLGSYKQTPFEDCTEEVYNELIQTLHDVDLSKIIEIEDLTDLKEQAACAGGACEIA